MAGAADFEQRAVHTLEAGKIVVWVKCPLAVLAIAKLGVYNLYYFRGLATAQAMDQAQGVGRVYSAQCRFEKFFPAVGRRPGYRR